MPHTAFICPDPIQWTVDHETGYLIREVPIDKCLSCSLTRIDRACPWDYADLKARVENYNSVYSPSRMNGCNREAWLKERNNYAIEPGRASKKARGTSVHAGLETSHDLLISEARVYRWLQDDTDPDNGWMVSVQPDKVYPGTETIHDDKTWSYLPVGAPEALPGQPKPVELKVGTDGQPSEYLRQLATGAWAWAKPNRVEYNDGRVDESPTPVKITNGQITIRAQVTLRTPGLPILDFAEHEAWMRARCREIERDRASDEAPGYVDITKRWRCGSCSVLHLCGIPASLYSKPRAAKKAAPPTRGSGVTETREETLAKKVVARRTR